MNLFRSTLGFLAASALSLGAAAQTPAAKPDPKAATAHLQQLFTASSLDHPGVMPWHFHMNFTLFDLLGRQQETGTIEEWWVSPQQYKIVIDSPSFKGTLSGTPAPLRTREAYLVDALLREVVHPISPLLLASDLTMTDLPVTYAKTALQCVSTFRTVKVIDDNQLLPGPKFCTAPNSDALRIAFDEGDQAVIRNQLGLFLHTQVALEHTINYDGKTAISGKIDKLEVFDPKKIEIPVAAQTTLAVPGIVATGKVLDHDPPPIPPAASANHIYGSVVLGITITEAGKVSDIAVLSSPNPILSGASVNAIGQWTYTPFTVNGAFTKATSIVTVHFLEGGGGRGR